MVGGALCTSDDALAERLRFLQNAIGAVPSPFDCYLVLRGLKTLAVRMDRHCENARAVVDALVEHPAVERVLYPMLPDHPGHRAAAKQMRDLAGMVSFLAAAGEEAALSLVASTTLFTLAESLGAVESLIEHPARMTHASAADSPLAVDPALVRLSVGQESIDDLVAERGVCVSKVIVDAGGGGHAPEQAGAGVAPAIQRGYGRPQDVVLVGPKRLGGRGRRSRSAGIEVVHAHRGQDGSEERRPQG